MTNTLHGKNTAFNSNYRWDIQLNQPCSIAMLVYERVFRCSWHDGVLVAQVSVLTFNVRQIQLLVKKLLGSVEYNFFCLRFISWMVDQVGPILQCVEKHKILSSATATWHFVYQNMCNIDIRWRQLRKFRYYPSNFGLKLWATNHVQCPFSVLGLDLE